MALCFQAYHLETVVDGQGKKAECLCCWHDNLLVGCQDGSTLFYRQVLDPTHGEWRWQLAKSHRSMERKALLQMAAVSHRPMLLSLTEEGVSLHTLPDMSLKCLALRSKGGSAFAWQEDLKVLAVAVKRKVILFRLSGSDLSEVAEASITEPVITMTWLGRLLILGTKRAYMQLSFGAALLPAAASRSNGGASSNGGSGASGSAPSCTDICLLGTAPRPGMSLCPSSNEVLLLHDNQAWFYAPGPQDASTLVRSRRKFLQWSGAVTALAAAEHYALALVGRNVEVRPLRRSAEGQLVQHIELPSEGRFILAAASPQQAGWAVSGVPTGSGLQQRLGSQTTLAGMQGPVPGQQRVLFVACAGEASGVGANTQQSICLRRLMPVPVEDQALALAELGEYQEALAMAELVGDDEAEEDQGHHGLYLGQAANTPSTLSRASSGALCQSAGGTEGVAGAAGSIAATQASTSNSAPQEPERVHVQARRLRAEQRRRLLEDQLRVAYGHHLFRSGDYDEGMAQLALCRCTSALLLLHLFPSLVPDKFKHALPSLAAAKPLPAVDEPQGPHYASAVSCLLPYLLSHRTRVLAAQQAQNEQRKSVAAAAAAGDAAGNAAAAASISQGGMEVGKQPEESQAEADRAVSHSNTSTSSSKMMPAASRLGLSKRRCSGSDSRSTGTGQRSSVVAAAAADAASSDSEDSVDEGTDTAAASGRPPRPPRRPAGVVQPAGSSARASTNGINGSFSTLAGMPAGVIGGAGRNSMSEQPPGINQPQQHKQQEEEQEQTQGSTDVQAEAAEACGILLGGLEPVQLLTIIDTAIVRVMVVMPDTGALLRFVQLPNSVDLDEGEEALRSAGMYAELAALYKAHGCHGKGLALLKACSQDPGSLSTPPRGAAADLPGLPGVWAAVRYLVHLNEAEAALIQEHAGWILAADPEAGLTAFLQMRPPLHPSLALSILSTHSRSYCALYLEAALQMGVALPQDYHSELLLFYLADLLGQHQKEEDARASKRHASLSHLLRLQGQQQLEKQQEQQQGSDMLALFPAKHKERQHPAAHVNMQPGRGDSFTAAARRVASAPVSQNATPVVGSPLAASPISSALGSPADLRKLEGSSQGLPPKQDAADSIAEPEPLHSKGHHRQNSAAHLSNASAHPQAASDTGMRAHVGFKPSAVHEDARVADNSQPAVKPPNTPQEKITITKEDETPSSSGGSLFSPQRSTRTEPTLYQRLRDLVYTSPYIDPNYVLSKLPPGQLLEIRALMLERLGRHRDALRIYVHCLHDMPAAEAYCDRVYVSVSSQEQQHAAYPGSNAGAVSDHKLDTAAAAYSATARKAGSNSSGPARSIRPESRSGDNDGMRSLLTESAVGLTLGSVPGRPGAIYLELLQAIYDGPGSADIGLYPPASVGTAMGSSLLGDGQNGQVVLGLEKASASALDAESWGALCMLLARKRGRVDWSDVLSMLPGDVPLSHVMPLVEGSLRHAAEEQRNLSVLRQLRRCENLSAREELATARAARVLVTPERACSLCHKRIGTTVFVAYPDGMTLAHYLCFRRHEPEAAAAATAAQQQQQQVHQHHAYAGSWGSVAGSSGGLVGLGAGFGQQAYGGFGALA